MVFDLLAPDLLMEPEAQWVMALELAWATCVLLYVHMRGARA